MGNSNLPEDTDVLICGAGPSGLATALSISFRNPKIRLTIVDALESGQNESRAIVLHPNTMETMESIGCAEVLSREGIVGKTATLQNANAPLIQAEFSQLTEWTKFPYMLMMSQAHIEAVFMRVLKERNVVIFRPYKIIAIRELDAESGFLATFENGENIKAKNIVGADGSRSTVRSFASIPFADPGPAKNPIVRFFSRPVPIFVVVDVTFETPLPKETAMHSGVIVTLNSLGFFIFAAMPEYDPSTGHRKDTFFYRIAFGVPKEDEDRARNLANEREFLEQKLAHAFRYHATNSSEKSVSPSELPKVKEVLWSSTFRVRYGIADTFLQHFQNGGNVLLVGDAAHIHTPAGAQGMNMGICDGVQAGAAIVAHMESGDIQPLEDYANRRRQIAVETIQSTKVMGWVESTSQPFARWFRNALL